MTDRVYDYNINADQSPEVSITLNGTKFPCAPDIDGLTMLETVAGLNGDDVASSAGVVTKFLELALGPNYLAFQDVVKKPGSGVTLPRLVQMVSDIIQDYADFPTNPPEPS